MDLKTGLVEVAVAICLLAGAFIALALMMGNIVYQRGVRELKRSNFPSRDGNKK
jgi:hypothetical protein